MLCCHRVPSLQCYAKECVGDFYSYTEFRAVDSLFPGTRLGYPSPFV